MGVFTLILIAIAVSIDGFWGGLAFGLRKIRITLTSLLVISSWSILCTFIAMLIGHNIKGYIPIEWAKYIGAFLLFLLGIFTLIEGYKKKKEHIILEEEPIKNKFNIFAILNNPLLADVDKQNDIKPSEGNLLGIAVAMDASIAAFTLSILGFSPYICPFLFGISHFILIGSGNIIGKLNILRLIGEKFSLLPGIILIGLALLRLV